MIADGSITFLPGMMDPMCGTTSVEYRMGPMQMMMQDAKLMGSNIMRCWPEMMRGVASGEMIPGSVSEMRDLCLQMGLGWVEMCGIGMVW